MRFNNRLISICVPLSPLCSSLGVELVSVDHRVFQVQSNLLKLVPLCALWLRRRHLLLLLPRPEAVVLVDVPGAREFPVALLRSRLRHPQRVEFSSFLWTHRVGHLRVRKALQAHRSLPGGLAPDFP